MGLHGKLVAAIEFRKGGDVFHDLITNNPHHTSNIIPHKVQACDLIEGEYGKVGSIICWRYTHDGKPKTAKQLIQAIDDENKRIELKILEGDLLEDYKDFLISIHVETKGDTDLVTWTLEYEARHEEVEPPISLLIYCIEFIKEVEAHYLKDT